MGGRNTLAMTDLVALFHDAGCRNVRTYIQSGNVVFRADAAMSSRLPTLITNAIAANFGVTAPIVTRTAAELEGVVQSNPFLQAGADPKTLHVAFLANRPGASSTATLDPYHSPPDEFVVRGREIYLHCPSGYGRSKLTTQYFDARLKTTSTVRNWNTVLKLLELTIGR